MSTDGNSRGFTGGSSSCTDVSADGYTESNRGDATQSAEFQRVTMSIEEKTATTTPRSERSTVIEQTITTKSMVFGSAEMHQCHEGGQPRDGVKIPNLIEAEAAAPWSRDFDGANNHHQPNNSRGENRLPVAELPSNGGGKLATATLYNCLQQQFHFLSALTPEQQFDWLASLSTSQQALLLQSLSQLSLSAPGIAQTAVPAGNNPQFSAGKILTVNDSTERIDGGVVGGSGHDVGETRTTTSGNFGNTAVGWGGGNAARRGVSIAVARPTGRRGQRWTAAAPRGTVTMTTPQPVTMATVAAGCRGMATTTMHLVVATAMVVAASPLRGSSSSNSR